MIVCHFIGRTNINDCNVGSIVVSKPNANFRFRIREDYISVDLGGEEKVSNLVATAFE
jgi:hypothetical protein